MIGGRDQNCWPLLVAHCLSTAGGTTWPTCWCIRSGSSATMLVSAESHRRKSSLQKRACCAPPCCPLPLHLLAVHIGSSAFLLCLFARRLTIVGSLRTGTCCSTINKCGTCADILHAQLNRWLDSWLHADPPRRARTARRPSLGPRHTYYNVQVQLTPKRTEKGKGSTHGGFGLGGRPRRSNCQWQPKAFSHVPKSHHTRAFRRACIRSL